MARIHSAPMTCPISLPTGGDLMTDVRKVLRVGAWREGELARRLNWPNIAAFLVWLLSVGTLLVGAVRSRKRLSVVPTPPAG